MQEKLYLGNLDAQRDWGYAPEYVEGMWQMLQQAAPDDYVLATGEAHGGGFLELAFEEAGLDWQAYVEIDPDYYRPTEIDRLVGDASKARKRLGWAPRTVPGPGESDDRGRYTNAGGQAQRPLGTKNVSARRRMKALGDFFLPSAAVFLTACWAVVLRPRVLASWPKQQINGALRCPALSSAGRI